MGRAGEAVDVNERGGHDVFATRSGSSPQRCVASARFAMERPSTGPLLIAATLLSLILLALIAYWLYAL